MDDWRRNHVPAFGSWDSNHDLPFTQCFESARQPPLIHRDLYVAGDLYANHLVTPAMILVPRRNGKANQKQVEEEEEEEEKKEGWVMCDYDYGYENDFKPSQTRRRQSSKAADEDLYRISPELLFAKSKRKKAWGFFSSCCLLPTSVM